MCEELSSFNKLDQWNHNSSSRNMNHENLENISYQNTVLLDITESKGHCFDKGRQVIKKKSKFKLVDRSCNTRKKQKALLRVSSIQKSCKISDAKAIETSVVSDRNLSENICFKKESKYKKALCKRKQKLSFIDLQQNSTTPIKARGRPPEKKKAEKVIKMQNRKSKKASACINKQVKSYSISTDLTMSKECRVLSPLKEIESTEYSEGSVDFTSNEIFSKFNYESYYNNNLDCFTWDDSDETYNFLITTYDSNNHEKENDINDNEFETCNKTEDCCLMKNKQKEGNIIVIKSSTFSEYLCENDSLPDNKKSRSNSCSSKSCCDYCCNDYALNLVTDNVNKSGLLEDVFNEDLPNNLDTPHLYNTKSNTYLTDEFLNECNNSFLQDLEDFDSSLTNFIIYSNEKTMEMEMFNQNAQAKKEDNNNVLNNSDYEADFDGISLISDKEWEDLLNVDINGDSTKKKEHKSSLFHHSRVAHQVRTNHNASGKFICSVCKKVYVRYGAFENHTKEHEKPKKAPRKHKNAQKK